MGFRWTKNILRQRDDLYVYGYNYYLNFCILKRRLTGGEDDSRTRAALKIDGPGYLPRGQLWAPVFRQARKLSCR